MVLLRTTLPLLPLPVVVAAAIAGAVVETRDTVRDVLTSVVTEPRVQLLTVGAQVVTVYTAVTYRVEVT